MVKLERISLDDICYNDELRRRGLMILGIVENGLAVFGERKLLSCGHPVTCESEYGCRACALGIPRETEP